MEPDTKDKVSQRIVSHNPSGGNNFALVVGFSARALAEAVRETGSRVIAVDAFGDFDTRETAKVPQILSNWGAPNSELSLSPATWTYYSEIVRDQLPVFLAGGLENWPALLDHLHSIPTLRVFGPSVVEMTALRDPSNWESATNGTSVRFPDTVKSPHACDGDENRWLLKRISGAGGLGVTQFTADQFTELALGTYLQRKIPGRSIGVSCIAEGGPDCRVDFVGATESWDVNDWPAPTEFIYRGSFGPIELSKPQQEAVAKVARNLLASQVPAYRGWIQMDFIEEPSGQMWLLEVNPRWTSGMEILRLSDVANMAALHTESQGLNSKPDSDTPPNLEKIPKLYVGKAVVYATRDVTLTPKLLEQLHSLDRSAFKDLPSAESVGTTIALGHPLLTVFAKFEQAFNGEQLARMAILKELEQRRLEVNRLCHQS